MDTIEETNNQEFDIEEIEKSPFKNGNDDIIYGNDEWNDYLLNSFDYHYPLLNQVYSKLICDIEWIFVNENNDNDYEEYCIDFSYIETKNKQKYLILSSQLKFNSDAEINELTTLFIYITSKGINDLTINNTDINFLTDSYYFKFICSCKVCSPEEYTINTIQYFYPINRNINSVILKNCIIKLRDYIMSDEY